MRSNRGKRIFKETSEAPVWYLQLWQSLSVDLHADHGIISTIDKSGFLRTFTSTIMPVIASVLIIAPIVNTWQTLKNFYRSKNKNFDKTLDLFVNILMTLTSVGVMATLIAGIVYVSPYILLLAMTVSLGYGIYNVVKHAYAAWCAKEEGDKERSKQHLWAIPYHIVLTILSTLGLLVQLNYAFSIVAFHGIFNIVQISNSSFTIAQVLLYVFGFTITLSTMPAFARQIMEYNAGTLKILRSPLKYLNELIYGKDSPEGHSNGLWDRIKNGYAFSKAQPLKAALFFLPTVVLLAAELVGVAALVAVRVIAGALAPVQFVGSMVTRALNFIWDVITPAPQIADLREDPISLDKRYSTAQATRGLLIARHEKLKTAIDAEMEHLLTQEATPKIIAKFNFMSLLKCKLGENIHDFNNEISMDEIEDHAMEMSPRLYQSFWRQEGRVEKIARQFDELDEGLNEAVRLNYLETPGAPEKEVEEEKESNDGPSNDSHIIQVRYGANGYRN
jgi:hypothetical protein